MRVVAAIDSFKGSLSSLEAGEAVKEGILRVYPDAKVQVCPLADGGEGTVEALTFGMGGRLEQVSVTGPLGHKVQANYGIVEEKKLAIMEMAAAAGITLLKAEERDPLGTTTYGVGEMILDAIRKGCRRFMIGIGGSATNDGGIGMLQALGYHFLDPDGKEVCFGAKGLSDIVQIRSEERCAALRECVFQVACDVTNPLCGEEGCSAVFGPQKGATEEMVKMMDRWLSDYAELTGKHLTAQGRKDAADLRNIPGTGAAGGLGFAFLAFLRAVLEPGIQIVLEEIGFEEQVRVADVVITGEGRLDRQTAMGKAPVGVAKLAKKCQKPVIAFAGSVSEEAGVLNRYGIDAFFPIVRGALTLEDAMKKENAGRNLADTAEQVFRLYKLSHTENGDTI